MGPNSPRQGRRDTTLGTAVTKTEKASVEKAIRLEGFPEPSPMIREILFAYRDSKEVRNAVAEHRHQVVTREFSKVA
jgi:hypothetical protein